MFLLVVVTYAQTDASILFKSNEIEQHTLVDETNAAETKLYTDQGLQIRMGQVKYISFHTEPTQFLSELLSSNYVEYSVNENLKNRIPKVKLTHSDQLTEISYDSDLYRFGRGRMIGKLTQVGGLLLGILSLTQSNSELGVASMVVTGVGLTIDIAAGIPINKKRR